MLVPLRVALGFLTRLPVAPREWSADTWQASLAWYPIAGLVIGLCVVAAAWLAQCFFDPLLAAALTVLVMCLLTGGLHLDGLADSADAWMGAPGDRERTLRILKDVHAGSAAIWAVTLLLITKTLAIAALLTAFLTETSGAILCGLLLAPAVARLTAPVLFVCTPYARREGGLGSHLSGDSIGLPCVLAAAAIVALTVMSAGPLHTAVLIISQVLLFVACRAAMMRRLGGTTGDTAGALVEISEVTWLLAWVAR
jgi:adenosylcobinamide-GDP ribazoletransferase